MIEPPEPPPQPWTAEAESLRAPLIAPRMPQPEVARPFPILATVAPVLGSVAIWLITSSPFALVFAALGPLIAVASVGDQIFGGRRRHRRAIRSFLRSLVAFEERIVERHRVERADLDRRFPEMFDDVESLRSEDSGARPDDPTWPLLVRVGRGIVRSRSRVDAGGTAAGDTAADTAGGPTAAQRRRPDTQALTTRLAATIASATRLDDAPLVVDARGAIGVCGPMAAMLPIARAVAMQLALALPAATTVISVPGSSAWTWMQALPHRVVPVPGAQGGPGAPDGLGTRSVAELSAPHADTVLFDTAGERIALVLAPTRAALPPSVATVLSVEPRCTMMRAGDGNPVDIRPALLSDEQATSLARIICERSSSALRATGPPESVAFADLAAAVRPSSSERGLRTALPAIVGKDAEGPVLLDLVRDGPHAVIGGTTGSGKSELLVTWVLALASRHPPTVVTFLLVDFKGGATMASLARLPHTLGVVTDLDHIGATRAVLSLSAELRRRERLLAEAGCRSLEELPQDQVLPRLVIVVDEFAALVSDAPELSTLFADLAARGRSLGIHLLLCTQRPAGVVREAVLANCTLRISLRVTTAADSVAVIGSPAASALPRDPAGRAFVSVAGEPVREVQIAQAREADHLMIERRWPRAALPRPWCPPLPGSIAPEDLPPMEGAAEESSTSVVFGLADLPHLQKQSAEVWNPRREGSLLVIGRAGSGRSSTLRAVRSSANGLGWSTVSMPPVPADAWDLLLALELSLGATPRCPGRLVLIDDVDALLARFSDEHRQAATDGLVRIVRDGPADGIHLVAGARRITPTLQTLAAVMDSRLLLALPSRHEHVLAGGSTDTFEAELPPGAGHRGERRVQVAWVPPSVTTSDPQRIPPPALSMRSGMMTAVVTTSPGRVAAHCEQQATAIIDLSVLDSGGSSALVTGAADATIPTFIVGTPDAWQARWSVLSTLRSRGDLIVHGCSVVEFRAISGSRRLPPPLAEPGLDAWCLSRGGEITRVRL